MLKMSNRGNFQPFSIDKLIKARLGKEANGKDVKNDRHILTFQMLCLMASINSWIDWIMEDMNSLIMNLNHLYF